MAALRLAISAEARAWDSGEDHGQLRRAWPLDPLEHSELEEFHQYLISTKGLSKYTADIHVQKVSYVLGIVSPTTSPRVASQWPLHVYLESLYLSGITTELLGLPILSPKLPWTKSIQVALCHLCDYAVLVCGRKNQQEFIRCVNGLVQEVLAPLKVQVNKESKVRALLLGLV